MRGTVNILPLPANSHSVEFSERMDGILHNKMSLRRNFLLNLERHFIEQTREF